MTAVANDLISKIPRWLLTKGQNNSIQEKINTIFVSKIVEENVNFQTSICQKSWIIDWVGYRIMILIYFFKHVNDYFTNNILWLVSSRSLGLNADINKR